MKETNLGWYDFDTVVPYKDKDIIQEMEPVVRIQSTNMQMILWGMYKRTEKTLLRDKTDKLCRENTSIGMVEKRLELRNSLSLFLDSENDPRSL